MNATLKKHLDAIKSGAITKTNIIGLRKAFNANARLSRGYSLGVTSPRVTIDDIGELRRAITMHEPRVSRERPQGAPGSTLSQSLDSGPSAHH